MMSESLDSQSELLGLKKQKANPKSFFTVPGLFVGLSNNGLSDSDSVRSPTSPLELRVCSNITESSIRSPRSSQNGHQSNLGCTKVGLSIVDSLDDNINRSAEIVFGPAMRIKSPKNQTAPTKFFQEPKPMPKNISVFPQTQSKNYTENGKSGVVFEIGENPSESERFGSNDWSCSVDSCRSSSDGTGLAHCESNSGPGNISLETTASRAGSLSELAWENPNSNRFSGSKLMSISGSIGSSNGVIGLFSASEVELSEDYTCVISRGPNPKTTHIFGGQILERHNIEFNGFSDEEKNQLVRLPASTKFFTGFPSDNFLNFCDFCNKKLEEGKDTYMYREKAFCSLDCRLQVILMDMGTEEAMDPSPRNLDKPHNAQDVLKTGIDFTA